MLGERQRRGNALTTRPIKGASSSDGTRPMRKLMATTHIRDERERIVVRGWIATFLAVLGIGGVAMREAFAWYDWFWIVPVAAIVTPGFLLIGSFVAYGLLRARETWFADTALDRLWRRVSALRRQS